MLARFTAAAHPPLLATSAAHAVSVGMSEALPVKKRGLPPGEGPDGDAPWVVGKVQALDFLRLSDDDQKSFLGFNFAYYREAEIKHDRLAMLAAVAWPLQEIVNPLFVEAAYEATGLQLVDVLDASNGASPSLLNG